jgi:hypothetical protein
VKLPKSNVDFPLPTDDVMLESCENTQYPRVLPVIEFVLSDDII